MREGRGARAGEGGGPTCPPPHRVLCAQVSVFPDEGRTHGPTRGLRTPWLGFMWWGSWVAQASTSSRALPYPRAALRPHLDGGGRAGGDREETSPPSLSSTLFPGLPHPPAPCPQPGGREGGGGRRLGAGLARGAGGRAREGWGEARGGAARGSMGEAGEESQSPERS